MMISYLNWVIPLCMFLVGLVPILAYINRTGTSWKIILSGGVLLMLAAIIKIFLAYLITVPVYNSFISTYPIIYYLDVGLLTGILETFIPLAFILRYKDKFSELKDQIGFGIGFGSFESLLVGFFILIGFIVAIFFPSLMPTELMQYFSSNAGISSTDILINAFFTSLERLSAIAIQVFSLYLVFLFVFSKRLKFLILEVLLKIFLDGSSAYFIVEKYAEYNVVLFYVFIGAILLYLMFRMLKKNKVGEEARIQKV